MIIIIDNYNNNYNNNNNNYSENMVTTTATTSRTTIITTITEYKKRTISAIVLIIPLRNDTYVLIWE